MIALAPNDNGLFPLMTINSSGLPVYDVSLTIRSHVDLPFDTPAHQAEAMHYMLHPDRVDIGTVPLGAESTIFLAPGYYQIDIQTRYAKYTEMLKFGPFGSTVGRQSYIISDYRGKVFDKHTSPDGFPKVYND
jgi:hypothetical protein